MNLDPKTKIQLVSEIWDYFKERFCKETEQTDYYGEPLLDCDSGKIKLFLQHVGVVFSKADRFDSEDFFLQIEDQKLVALHNYITNQKSEGFVDLFFDKYALEVLRSEEKFSNLNFYLEECFECVVANRKIAAAILLRACVEILVGLKGCIEQNSKGRYDGLNKTLIKFINLVESDEDFKIFAKYGKKEELRIFLNGIKELGDSSAHLYDKKVHDFIENNAVKEMLKLFCLLIEHSILKEEISRRNEQELENRFKSIDFTPLQEKTKNAAGKHQVAKTFEQVDSGDDEIPF